MRLSVSLKLLNDALTESKVVVYCVQDIKCVVAGGVDEKESRGDSCSKGGRQWWTSNSVLVTLLA